MKKIYKILLVCGLLLLIIGFIFMFLNKKQSKPLIKVTADISKKLKDDSYKLLGYFIEDRNVNFSKMSNEEKTAAVVYISLPNYKESKIQKEYNDYFEGDISKKSYKNSKISYTYKNGFTNIVRKDNNINFRVESTEVSDSDKYYSIIRKVSYFEVKDGKYIIYDSINKKNKLSEVNIDTSKDIYILPSVNYDKSKISTIIYKYEKKINRLNLVSIEVK